jgi:L-iditol 2-dehydrogenase
MYSVTSPSLGAIEVVERAIPEIGPGEVLVELIACGLCGTDLMKVDTPDQPRPFQLGHEVVGRVFARGEGVHLAEGTRVALAHHVPDFASHYTRRGSSTMDPVFKRSNIDPGGFADFIRVPAPQVQHSLLPLPEAVPEERAVFMEPLACCLRAIDRIDVSEGDSALLFGVGAAGMLFLPLLRDRSVQVIAADVRDQALDVARFWGAEQTANVKKVDVSEVARSATSGRGVDVVFLTVVNPAVWAQAMAAVRDGGSIVLFGVKPSTRMETDFWALWRREINVVSSYSATTEGLNRSLAILRGQGWALEQTISHRIPLRDAAQAFQLVRTGAASKVVILRE